MLAPCLILIFQARSSCCCAVGLGTDAVQVKPGWREFGFSVYRIQSSPQQQKRCGSRLPKEREKGAVAVVLRWSTRAKKPQEMKMARGNM